ncbi:conserved hypothetical protein [Caldicellulosiruptor hydrothermalis 108]|uniref:Uncharacterized protein n=1 Tax=Caldicellulosiruptor hydrothermalis (strain DSM 18901 / VKM B-2411 / 108) TaxID=632292 RepID=E4QA67_CALH1|nr:hypothetical protein [Caldicellulosiruptor hydrothermalis]ADQ07039.1 conserved hypothetical protein [Caldicellulosiruptor hydrothermalis 108]
MILPTSFFGFSKPQVRSYIENLTQSFGNLISKLDRERDLLTLENERLAKEIEKLKKNLTNLHIKDIEYYKAFIEDFFVSEWEEYYSKKAQEVQIEYSKTLDELEKIKESIIQHIQYLEKYKEEILKRLCTLVDEIEKFLGDDGSLPAKKLQRDFYVDDELVLPAGIVINHEVIESMRKKGFLIEFLKHLAKEEEE